MRAVSDEQSVPYELGWEVGQKKQSMDWDAIFQPVSGKPTLIPISSTSRSLGKGAGLVGLTLPTALCSHLERIH